MTDDHGRLRISNADRDQAIQQLQAALDEGRIDLAEFDDRTKAAYEAKTNAELDLIFDDLPGGRPKEAEVVPAGPAPEPGHGHGWGHGGRGPGGRGVPSALRGLIAVGGMTTAIWLVSSIASGHFGYFWPIWPMLGLGIATVMQFVGGGGDDDGDERRRDRREERRDRRDRRY